MYICIYKYFAVLELTNNLAAHMHSISGMPRNMNIEFCKCKLDAHWLMELGYWPAT